ncbi:MAG: helix-turn-helix transcriptional regulator, partial [bacterium]|nr:helix-turn-helix transcriptional regulator [bacterium]
MEAKETEMTKTKGRRAQQKEETRKLIIETACTLFSERGFDKTTIRAIAQKAGIAVGTLFVHFPDKPALLAATLYEDIEQVLQTAMATVPA